MDDLVQTIIDTDSHLTIAALSGNAGAGGAFLALAADFVYTRRSVVLNPHYKNMGNLYGSEYWTYLLPRRVAADGARDLLAGRLPISAVTAKRLGFIDDCFGTDSDDFRQQVEQCAQQLAELPTVHRLLSDKRQRRARDEREKPLARYRDEELEKMRLNFYGFDPSYHVARYNFVYRVPHSWTPLHLAEHRRNPAPVPNQALKAGARR
jgi:putative two-component system hydrogenase maturation factor HypX/HoxX